MALASATPHFTKRSAGTPIVVWAGGGSGHLLAPQSFLLHVPGVPEESLEAESECSHLSLSDNCGQRDTRSAHGGALGTGAECPMSAQHTRDRQLSRESQGGKCGVLQKCVETVYQLRPVWRLNNCVQILRHFFFFFKNQKPVILSNHVCTCCLPIVELGHGDTLSSCQHDGDTSLCPLSHSIFYCCEEPP